MCICVCVYYDQNDILKIVNQLKKRNMYIKFTGLHYFRLELNFTEKMFSGYKSFWITDHSVCVCYDQNDSTEIVTQQEKEK